MILFVGNFVKSENNLQTEEITLAQQQPSVVVDNAPLKRSLAQRMRREKERQIAIMDVTINITYSNTNVRINEENSFMVATLKRALAQPGNETIMPHASPMNDVNNHWNTLENAGENSDNCGVAPSKILGIDETTNSVTRLRNCSFKIGESSRGPSDIVNEPPQEPFMDEHFFNDLNMDSDFELNIDPLIHEIRHYFENIDIECLLYHALHWLDEKLTNSSHYRSLFGTCCKQGKIRLPILQPLPPAIQVLYDDDSSHAKSF
ncbi:hypothetical protein GIB67_042420 [Kingdonia uniflora]|uniref:Uncharacterized protein n=1 Tax=Kingdonia uniflora TaxID=39325 RepID=A0A7J7M874_9MAGN|nr:hypothetical protein GIB67_042420 [Kingdonia uniflora]